MCLSLLSKLSQCTILANPSVTTTCLCSGEAPAPPHPTELFAPTYSLALAPDPLLAANAAQHEAQRAQRDVFLAVGLDSGLTDFRRPRLNLVLLLDVSGSMDCSFDSHYYDAATGSQATLQGEGELYAACGCMGASAAAVDGAVALVVVGSGVEGASRHCCSIITTTFLIKSSLAAAAVRQMRGAPSWMWQKK